MVLKFLDASAEDPGNPNFQPVPAPGVGGKVYLRLYAPQVGAGCGTATIVATNNTSKTAAHGYARSLRTPAASKYTTAASNTKLSAYVLVIDNQ